MEASIQRRNISSQIYDILLRQIISKELVPGDRLVERDICEKFNVSRTPLRDAISLLAKDGFLLVEEKKGASVRKYSIKDIIEVYDIRAVLEGLAVKLSIDKIPMNELIKFKTLFEKSISDTLPIGDKEFHALIVNSCGNERLKSSLRNLDNIIEIFRTSGYLSKKRLESASKWHLKIIESIIDKQTELASKYMIRHIEQTKSEIISALI